MVYELTIGLEIGASNSANEPINFAWVLT